MSDHLPSGSANETLRLSQVEDDLECPVCLTVPTSPPIFQCRNGHLICKTCKVRLANCPTCRKPLGHFRNLLAEKLIAKIPPRCPFAEHGCDGRWELVMEKSISDLYEISILIFLAYHISMPFLFSSLLTFI